MSTMLARSSPLMLLGAVFLAACSDSPTSQRRGLTVTRNASVAALRATARGLDAEFLDLEAKIPGFAGLYIDKATGAPTVMLVDRRQSDVATTAVSEYLSARRPTVADAVRPAARVTDAAYTFSQLYNWKLQASASAFAIKGVVFIGIRHSLNQVEIGTESPDIDAAVLERLKAAGVPETAVLVSRANAPQLASAPDLGDKIRPLKPSLRVSRFLGGNVHKECTLSFTARFAGSPDVGVTASHCGPTEFGFDGALYNQAYSFQGGALGTEISDPPSFGGCDPDPAYTCRYSDAMTFSYNGASSIFGALTRTNGLGSGSIVINGIFPITAVVSYPLQGDIVDFIGSRGGWQRLDVQRPCYEIKQDLTNFKLLCQGMAGGVGPILGDSGAPVFYYAASGQYGWLGGIAWGYTKSPDPQGMWFSPMGGVFSELGAFTVY